MSEHFVVFSTNFIGFMIIVFWTAVFAVDYLFPAQGLPFMIGSIFGIFLVIANDKLARRNTFRRWVDKGRRQGYDGKESCFKENA
jgi:hypothetical protein